jgi:hypothetical protein
MTIISLLEMVSVLLVIIVLSVVLIRIDYKRRKEIAYDNEEGVTIFGERMNTMDYFSFVNSIVSYLLIYKEVDLNKFLDRTIMSFAYSNSANESDFHLLEKSINSYPIIACTYIGNGVFKLDKAASAKKYDELATKIGESEYIIPLFDFRLIDSHRNLFNFSTKFQQTKHIETVLNKDEIHDEIAHADETVAYLRTMEGNHLRSRRKLYNYSK